MTGTPVIPIQPTDRGMAVMTHLSGLSGYIIPMLGVIVPLIIWMTRKEEPVISAIARQAVLLNVAVFVAFGVTAILALTIILIPAVVLAWCALGLAALVLPVYGAIKANDGTYYRYPVVGSNP